MATVIEPGIEPPPAARPEPDPSPGLIGTAHQPVRVIAFSSGGADTAMHLGVMHALLTINGKAPDAVVGISAGAVNAAALAEVFQAAPDPADWSDLDPATRNQMLRERQHARVAKFRKMLEAYLSAPGELARALIPDTLQVEAQQPLRPLRLPIHDEQERKGRDRELHARQGFINLFNDLLGLSVSFATLTRLVRRVLGWRAAAEIRSKPGRWAARAFEATRGWALLGLNIARAERLFRRLLGPLFVERVRPTKGAPTAAAIIFKPRWLQFLLGQVRRALTILGLWLFWITVSVFAVGLPYFMVRLSRVAVHWFAGGDTATLLSRFAALMDRYFAGFVTAGYVLFAAVLTTGLLLTGAWGQVANFNHSTRLGALREAGWEAVGFLLLLGLYLVVPLSALVLAVWVPSGGSLVSALLPALALAEKGFWILMVAIVVTAISIWLRRPDSSYIQRLLARYDLADGLLSTHPLKQLYIRLFDPEYYGERCMDDVVERALRDSFEPSSTLPHSKLIVDYEKQSPPITVGFMVANVKTGDLEIVPQSTKVVDGLIAATSVSPLFPPVPIRGNLYLDGANITSEATSGVIPLLRDRVNPEASVIHVYSVSHLPFSQPTLAPTPAQRAQPYLNLLDVANRARQLQRFRDAALERRMTELFTRVIPPGRVVFPVNGRKFLRVWVAPVEPEAPLELNDRLARCCSNDESRQLISEAVADGCRATLEVMLHGSVPDGYQKTVPCRVAVEAHLAKAKPSASLPLLVDLDCRTTTEPDTAPGLPDVCRHCALFRNGHNGSSPRPAELVIREWKQVGPVWPHELERPPESTDGKVSTLSGRWGVKPGDEDPHFVRAKPAYEQRTSEALSALNENYWRGYQNLAAADRWPCDRNGRAPGHQRPLVNLLFSGGVFRGVYQLGTLCALSEAGLEPDVIAGASVGSITGAMVAQALALKSGADRDARIARLAATYLAMDRLVLTDRFADFIRGVTLRAAATRFSLQQADRFLRRYDQASSAGFDREARMVMAGLERLFYLSPFELKELVKAFRLQKSDQIYKLLRSHTQEWLDRMGVGNQILGAEPLALLITEHVLRPLSGEHFTGPESVPFDRYLSEAGMYFLATATNLTEGRLEILGEQQLQGRDNATLLEGLLASSAFPGVFRPRWSWEVMPGSTRPHQYIDGGVMDNLPLDAVTHFLRLASEPDVGIVARRPKYHDRSVPHLLFSASLEINPPEPGDRELSRYLNEWPALWRRARQLRYNKKLDLYCETQQCIRAIWEAEGDRKTWEPVDLEVVMVRPRWLPGTFGFHPMLGFRRQRQAESIAHGCATALLELARVQRKHPDWAAGWGLDPEHLPANPPKSDRDPIVPGKAPPGHCWFRPGAVCPFSEQRLRTTGVPERTRAELMKIYTACGRAETHQAR